NVADGAAHVQNHLTTRPIQKNTGHNHARCSYQYYFSSQKFFNRFVWFLSGPTEKIDAFTPHSFSISRRYLYAFLVSFSIFFTSVNSYTYTGLLFFYDLY